MIVLDTSVIYALLDAADSRHRQALAWCVRTAFGPTRSRRASASANGACPATEWTAAPSASPAPPSSVIAATRLAFRRLSFAARDGRETVMLTGSCEIQESAETSTVLAVLNATNRWMQIER